MVGEIPLPERDNVIEASPFDVDAMDDDQIIVLNRGLSAIGLVGRMEGDSFDEMLVGFNLQDRLLGSVRELTLRNPERVKNLVSQYARSAQTADREFVASTVCSLVHYDYEFTRDTLIFLMVDQARQEISWDTVCEAAHDETRLMMRDHMTQDQIADFNAHLAVYGSGVVIAPALPGEC
jgi:hypothetical protein